MRQCNISSRNPIHSRIPIHLTLSPFFLFVCLFVPLEWDWEQSTTQCECSYVFCITLHRIVSLLLSVLFLCFFFPLSPPELDFPPTHLSLSYLSQAYPFFFEVTGQVSQNRTKSKSYITTKQKRSRAKASNLIIHLQDHPDSRLQSQSNRHHTIQTIQTDNTTYATAQYSTIQSIIGLGLYNTHHTPQNHPRVVSPVPRLLLHLLCCLALPLFGLHRWFVLPLD